ncbi:MAG TPA: cation:proton antiporter [Jiangellaceae bacterium]|jgi:Kef-type K+ transport system membrane component KefB|nr:cation:proton antiporter [Jiangellaceae bacterium]
MTGATVGALVIVVAVAVVAPIVADRLHTWLAVPVVVAEILLGILVGPDVLGLVTETDVISALSDLGLAFLMFLAGYEIDFARIKGRPLRLSVVGWLSSLVLGVAIGVGLAGADTGLVVGLALTTTALGTILPILRDAGQAASPFGSRVLAVGAVGEFGPILAIAFAFSGDRPIHTTAVLLVFAIAGLLAAMVARRPRHPQLARLVTATLGTSAQLGVRICVFVVIGMFALAELLGLDPVLGAFVAGVVAHLFLAAGSEHEEEAVVSRLEGIGFGFFIPLFFVVSGVRFDLDALVSDGQALLVLPVFLGMFLLVRGLPTWLLHRRELAGREPVALGLFAATALPLVVVITSIGVDEGALSPAIAASLVGSGMISVLLFPMLGLRLLPAPAAVEESFDQTGQPVEKEDFLGY